MSTELKTAPEGFRFNTKGHAVPLDQITPRELLEDQLVTGLCERAKKVSKQSGELRSAAQDDIAAFVQISAAEYDVEIGGKKGNVTNYSFEGRYKTMRKIANRIEFDERLQAAKAIIDECLNEWTKKGDPKARTVIQNAFETDGNGNVAPHKILELRRIQIDDPHWQRGMAAIADAIKIVGTKTYICFYEKNEHGKYIQIAIDPNKL